MEPEHIVEGLLMVWDDLPELLGPDNWRDVYRQLEKTLAALAQARSDGERGLEDHRLVASVSASCRCPRLSASDHRRFPTRTLGWGTRRRSFRCGRSSSTHSISLSTLVPLPVIPTLLPLAP